MSFLKNLFCFAFACLTLLGGASVSAEDAPAQTLARGATVQVWDVGRQYDLASMPETPSIATGIDTGTGFARTNLKRIQRLEGFSRAGMPAMVKWSGYWEVPEDGTWTFALTHTGRGGRFAGFLVVGDGQVRKKIYIASLKDQKQNDTLSVPLAKGAVFLALYYYDSLTAGTIGLAASLQNGGEQTVIAPAKLFHKTEK